ncbi:MAG TPA: sporulation protein [Gammaproteobacteria bacterium]|nr:sporulation protein [Gammaproteobacteria bacterium]
MSREPAAENRLKQRLVGASVLVALAVIFIPMMLGGKGSQEKLIGAGNIPPLPDDGRRTVEIPLQEPPPRPARKPVTTVVVDEYTGDLPDNFVPAAPDPAPQPAAGTPPAVSPAPKPVPPVAEGKETGGKPQGVADDIEAWVVQLGSFSERANAMALRDRVRSRKYAAFVEAVATSQGTIYRVRVGPERTRARAEALQERLRKAFNLNGMVFPHKELKG